MIGRIYLKGISLINSAIGSVVLFFERVGAIKKVDTTIFKEIPGVENINLAYPVNFNAKDEHLFAHYTAYETNDLVIYKFSNANVSIDGAIFKGVNNSVLSFPHPVFRKQFGLMYLLGQKLFKKKQIGDPNTAYIVLFDLWAAKNYYHWLIDALPRLLLVKEELKGRNTSLLLPETCSKFVLASLKYFNCDDPTFINKDSFFQAQNIIFPNYTAGSGHLHPSYVNEVKQHFIKSISSSMMKDRIYVSRGRQKARRIHNEREVINILIPLGFEIIYWEDMSFEEQVQTVRNTKILVTSHGANMTNTMFMPDNAKVLEIIRKDKPNFCYWALATVTNKRYYYQFCDIVGNDHLLVDIEQFKINLQKIIND